MSFMYQEDDGDLQHLSGRTVACIGYGNMGRPCALNLRDSGVNIIVSDPTEEKRALAADEGFRVAAVDTCVLEADSLLLLIRDEVMPQVYIEQVSPYLRRGQSLIFSSAYNIAFGFIEAPAFVDVGLIAARTLGTAVRERFVEGTGYTSFVAVGQDASRQAWQTVLALARALGALRGGAIEIRFEQEAELDLFLQQAVLPIFHEAIIKAADVLIRTGYPSDAVFTELYLSGESSDYLHAAARHGLLQALKSSSLTSQYGTLSRSQRIDDLKLERIMESTLDEIRSGRFAREWAREYAADYPRLKQLMKQREQLDLWELEQQTLDMLRRNQQTGD
ncbi:MAG: NAD(P)-binding domain-containing protein [Chloroflexota bacterium]|nr:NAD(P)-binding domain-containing protein [Chloroflexota bacterium]